MRLLLPTEEFPIRSSLQLVTEFVAAIDGDEEMVVGQDQTSSAPSSSVGWASTGSWRARGGLREWATHRKIRLAVVIHPLIRRTLLLSSSILAERVNGDRLLIVISILRHSDPDSRELVDINKLPLGTQLFPHKIWGRIRAPELPVFLRVFAADLLPFSPWTLATLVSVCYLYFVDR